jgi:hypothetical protein
LNRSNIHSRRWRSPETRSLTLALQLTAYSLRSSVAWSELCCCSGTRLTPGYCWSTPFKVLGVLFLGEVCSAFVPSKEACWAHQLRYVGVDQQYPPVCWTHAEQLHPGARACTETQSINQRRVGGGPGSFSTPADRSASQKLSTPVRLCPRLCGGPSRRRGRRPQPAQWPVGCRSDAEGTRPARSYPGPPWGFSTPRSSDAPPRTASA